MEYKELEKCPNCVSTLQYLDNDKNDLTYLKCPKCDYIDTEYDLYVTVQERIEQCYSIYVRTEEKIAEHMYEKLNGIDE